jgi:hypothetical protein
MANPRFPGPHGLVSFSRKTWAPSLSWVLIRPWQYEREFLNEEGRHLLPSVFFEECVLMRVIFSFFASGTISPRYNRCGMYKKHNTIPSNNSNASYTCFQRFSKVRFT